MVVPRPTGSAYEIGCEVEDGSPLIFCRRQSSGQTGEMRRTPVLDDLVRSVTRRVPLPVGHDGIGLLLVALARRRSQEDVVDPLDPDKDVLTVGVEVLDVEARH